MRYFLIALACLFALNLFAQSNFQQKVDYTLKAELDTLSRVLKVQASLHYYNNSPDTLNKLILHTWMNAFRDRNSEYARQQVQLGFRDFHFASEEDRGYYRELEFIRDNQKLNYSSFEDKVDIVELELDKAINPGDSSQISINYILQLPVAFDRPGYAQELYRMTQWYPKAAVYNQNAWHPMSYLSMGEFFSEFGDYEVELILPVSFSAAFTGTEDNSRSSINIADRTRSIFINATNVHDFAWFASESYVPYRESLERDDRSIAINLFVHEENNDWPSYFEMAKRAMHFLSDQICEYDWPQITIVESGFGEASGMEYPMITILDTRSGKQHTDHLIVHELAHQWFYGMLASNERKDPWIDEGFASFYDNKYINTYYRSKIYDEVIDELKLVSRPSGFHVLDQTLIHLDRIGWSECILNSSDTDDPLNYMMNNYTGMSNFLSYLEGYLGNRKFDAAVKELFKKYKFRHIAKSELKETFESVAGEDLSWFFEFLLENSDPIDFKCGRFSKHGESCSFTAGVPVAKEFPFKLQLLDKDNRILSTEWKKTTGMEDICIELECEACERIIINGETGLLESNYRNNSNDHDKINFPSPRIVNILEHPQKKTFGIIPHVFNNAYDGFLLGLTTYSPVFPQSRFRYSISPSFALSSQSIAGVFNIEKDFRLDHLSSIRKIRLGLHGRQFSYFKNESILPNPLAYRKLNPSIALHFGENYSEPISLEYQWHSISQDFSQFENSEFVESTRNFSVHRLILRKEKHDAIRSNKTIVALQYESYSDILEREKHYLRLELELDKAFYYSRQFRAYARIFTGWFPINTDRLSNSFSSVFTRGSFALSGQGFTDQLFSQYYFERSGSLDSRSSQVSIMDAGFKTVLESPATLGMSNDFITSANLRIDLPVYLPSQLRLRAYFDAAWSRVPGDVSDQLEGKIFYSGGLALEVNDIIGLYLPLVNSKEIDRAYGNSNIFERMSFKLDLTKINFWRLADEPHRWLYDASY